jgi:hypothetical protein
MVDSGCFAIGAAVAHSPVLALGLLGAFAIAVAIVVGAVVLFLIAAALFQKKELVREQRPFYICPECSAYNSRSEGACWRCAHDLTSSVIEPHGEMGSRLAKLDSAKNEPTSR